MFDHKFLFSPGLWIGEGRITFSASPDHLRFYTKWEIQQPDEEGKTYCVQQVEMQGGGDCVINEFFCSPLASGKFVIELQNELLGTISGTGVVDSKTIAWEFRGNPDFEGYEVYELQDNGDYMLHAEYASTEDFRTTVDGRIWLKGA